MDLLLLSFVIIKVNVVETARQVTRVFLKVFFFNQFPVEILRALC
jgi:hypothetical protein